ERTIIAIVDVSDPSDMDVTDIVRLEGNYASARLIDGIARIVLNTTQTGPELEQPTEPTVESQRQTLEKNKEIIEDADIKPWLPRFKVTDAKGTKRSEGPLATCATTYHPKQFSGFGNVSVVTIDPANPDPRNSASVLGSAGIVYASTDNLYVATQRWPEVQPFVIDDGAEPIAAPAPVPSSPKTSIHRFDIFDPKQAVYAASGEIDGTVLNQWSLSEHDGHLRVATTLDDFSGDPEATSTNGVIVLDAAAPKLDVVGEIGGLGKNERIYGVRFIGDLGYVVTFRQIDPLHVIDFSDPEDPELLGELKIPGYSAYLHPIGDTLLLGIGQDVAVGGPEEGRPLGVQMSLFDVADPREPTRIDQASVGGKNSYTPIEHDHHAFLWWEATSLAMVPADGYNEQTGVNRGGAYAFRVADRKITDIGSITHRNHVSDKNMSASISRSIVIGDDIYTLSIFGLMGSDLDTLDERGFVGFPQYTDDGSGGGGGTEPGVVEPQRVE
ncbi:MAG: beta-propeller domain-containing protein, partial [Actinomycetota bacterium]